MNGTGAVEILLVEDDPNDVELTLRALKASNLTNRIHVARDGVEALDFFFTSDHERKRPPSGAPRLVLLDLKLPKVGGLEVLQRLKSDPRTKTIPVVALTSSSEGRDIEEAYKLGINSYIVKPVEFDKFAEAVRELGLYWLLLNTPP